MKIPQIHTNLLWDLSALFVLLALTYLIILFLFRNGIFANLNKNEIRKNNIREIIGQLLLHEQGTVSAKTRAPIDLKIELWKLLQRVGNRRIMSNILIELNNGLDDRDKQIIHKLSKEFGLDIDFLIKSEPFNIKTSGNNIPPDPKSDDNNELKNIETIMEEPKFTKPLESQTQNIGLGTNVTKGEGLNLNFIPLVTKSGEIIDQTTLEFEEGLLINNDLDFLMECLSIEGFERNPYEEIFNEIEGNPTSLPQDEDASFLNIDFLPLIFEIEEVNEVIGPDLDMYQLEVDYEVVIDPFIKKQISNILKSHTEELSRKKNNLGQEDILLDLGEMVLPAAKFYTDREFRKVKLLHSIAEMGDIREVPLLNEMLDEEENESIGNIIRELIFRFLSEYPLDISEENGDNNIVDFGEHYVFNLLFNAVDRESQLLLLHEILEIGDITDYYFLITLHNHPDTVIAEKSKSVSSLLKAKLQAMATFESENHSHITSNPEMAFNEPPKLHLDPSITFELTKSGITSMDPIDGKIPENDRRLSQDLYHIENDDENLGANDLFEIDFDITTSENITFIHNKTHNRNGNLRELEDINFLYHIKELTNKFLKP